MAFTYSRKIYGYECDIYGHMNNANYLQIYEEARSEALDETKYSIHALSDLEMGIFVIRVELDYKKGVCFGEKIRIETHIQELNRVKGRWYQEIYNQNNDLCSTLTVFGAFVKNGRPTRLPKEIMEEYKKYID